MSEMIEYVALALEPKCRGFGKGDMPMQVAREFARAAIESMREPTDAMITGADHVNAYWHHDVGELASEWRDEMRQEYQAMIDEALK